MCQFLILGNISLLSGTDRSEIRRGFLRSHYWQLNTHACCRQLLAHSPRLAIGTDRTTFSPPGFGSGRPLSLGSLPASWDGRPHARSVTTPHSRMPGCGPAGTVGLFSPPGFGSGHPFLLFLHQAAQAHEFEVVDCQLCSPRRSRELCPVRTAEKGGPKKKGGARQ